MKKQIPMIKLNNFINQAYVLNYPNLKIRRFFMKKTFVSLLIAAIILSFCKRSIVGTLPTPHKI